MSSATATTRRPAARKARRPDPTGPAWSGGVRRPRPAADPVERIAKRIPRAAEGYGDWLCDVFTEVNNKAQEHGIECVAAMVDLVYGWPADAQGTDGRKVLNG